MLTSLKPLNIAHRTIIDELTGCAIVLFMASCFLSFLSIRCSRIGKRLENNANYLFLSGIILLFITTLLFPFNIIV